MSWQAWKPEFDEDRRLKDVLAEMPRDNANKIPWQVWLLENPDSPINFPGAISLYRHDCMHVLLCASFWAEDEAFVVGFTMGTANWRWKWMLKLFLWLTTWFYPGEYRWNKALKQDFLNGFYKGQRSGMRNLHEFPFEHYENVTLKELRNIVGVTWIDSPVSYQEWANHWPKFRFEKYAHLKNEKPSPTAKNRFTFLLRKTFAQNRDANP